MKTRDFVLMGLFAAIVAALGIIPKFQLPLGVPITAQTLGVMLAGAVLGAKRGAGALAIFVALVAMGLPLLAGGRGGIGVLMGPSGGFILGWIAGAFVTGLICERIVANFSPIKVFLACVVGGIGVVYLFGIPWWAFAADLPIGTVTVGSASFIPGDLLKAILATAVAVAVQRGYPILAPATR